MMLPFDILVFVVLAVWILTRDEGRTRLPSSGAESSEPPSTDLADVLPWRPALRVITPDRSEAPLVVRLRRHRHDEARRHRASTRRSL